MYDANLSLKLMFQVSTINISTQQNNSKELIKMHILIFNEQILLNIPIALKFIFLMLI